MRPKTLLAVAAMALLGVSVGLLLRGRRDVPAATSVQVTNAPSRPAAPDPRAVLFIEGTVAFTGEVPAAGKLFRQADPFCGQKEMTDPAVLVRDGKLQNVWVHVTSGAPDAAPPAAPVQIDQRDCMYEPRIALAVQGQKFLVRNDDPTLHNVHAYLGAATAFNRGMPNDKAEPIEATASGEGVLKLKCDVHPWMRGYVGVSRNGLQAVTGEAGTFRIGPLAPGRYTLEAWHEKLGAKTAEVTVEPGKPAQLDFGY